MEIQQIVYGKITECMKTIYAFCVSRTSNTHEAEDLSQEIIKELFRSANSLKDIKAFYGWMWGVANNVYKAYIRNNKKVFHYRLDETIEGTSSSNPELELIQNENLNVLRRELSLLSKFHRKATIMYYIENKSCKHISQEFEISLEMVKYFLFKSRKLLKEGMSMSRNYGEKSYNPAAFSVDVWMEENEYKLYYELFKRKLPGNILMVAYYNSMSLGEISMELGVSVPYLEDEINILKEHNLIKQLKNARYQSNIVIFTQSCEEDIFKKTKGIFESVADEIFEFIQKKEAEIRKINFKISGNKNTLYWLVSHIALLQGRIMARKELRGNERFPMLSNGTHGFVWGNNSEQSNVLFNGIYGDCEVEPDGDWVNVCNYKIIHKCQEFHPEEEDIAVLVEAARADIKESNSEKLIDLIKEGYILNNDGSYDVNFPVLTERQYDELVKLLEPVIEMITENIKKIIEEVTNVVQNHAPVQLADICTTISLIKYHTYAVGYIVEEMCGKGFLTAPNSLEKLGMYAVIKK
ncbi:RNA polymerase sigma factor [Oceanirhabdus seepicola]|uniref:Sigma-70 family RNA polymerase sigma factor n=1 Tax=Oceanirhabdus seepicola TaxID=2828781 RepID=A0A9J6NYS3_9CLOT|nr:sigma-70 family RNA polymerase sigma factor [Oceanirhabdus seepicola]MCM1989204.1 sigma-70 family RNA polymerase sigma factor [Oceanirhabdus seepicola]